MAAPGIRALQRSLDLRKEGMMKNTVVAFAGLLVLAGMAWPQEGSPLERYRNVQFPATAENFDKGWKDRVVLEYEIVNNADLHALRNALKDRDPFVRAMAARALGIRSDKASADTLADLVKSDPEPMVRARAVESLGYLKMKLDVLALAEKDKDLFVRWVANLAVGQAQSDTGYAEPLRKAFAQGIKREVLGMARVGQPAPDFTALTVDGKEFKFSTVLGKKPIAMYFAAFDG
jgi:hypothetical protein